MHEVIHIISTPSGVGGAERVLASLAAGDSTRCRHRVLNPFAAGPDGVNGELAALCQVAGAEYRPYRCSIGRELVGARRWLARELAAAEGAVIHVHLFHALTLTAATRWPSPARYLLTHHHGDRFVAEGQRVKAAVDRLSGRRFPTVVAVSDWTRSFLIERYGYRPERIITIRNGWSGTPQRSARGDRPPTVVCVGHLRAQKGHDTLIRAVARVVDEVAGARLLIVGEGEARTSLEGLIRREGLTERVELRGHTDDVWKVLRDADVFALASRYEPLGISLLEGMAAGLPVVATAVGGIPEVVTPECGYLVEPDRPAAFASRLTHLLLDPGLRSRLGNAGERRAATMRMTDTVTAYEQLYDDLAKR